MKRFSVLFQISMAVALIGWILLLVFPKWAMAETLIISVVVVLLCAMYVYILFIVKNIPGEKYPKGNFRTLEGVVNLFKNPRGVLIGWIHYLAFDLMIGLYIKNDAEALGINLWYILPCQLLTLVFGPAGFLSYLLLRYFLA